MVTKRGGEESATHRRGRGSRGVALVEFAIIMPILFLLIFGIIEFGTAFNDYQALRQGTREGARNAVVADYGSSGSCGINGAASSAVGTNADNSRKVICTVKQEVGLTSSSLTRVKVVFTDSSPGFANDKVKVCSVRMVRNITGFLAPFLKNRSLKTEIEMRVEKDVVLLSTEETDPSGSAWSWC
jgi:hypothetical protein